MSEYADDLRITVEKSSREFLTVDPALAARRPGSDRWSAKEILGHLVDSACNNHQRFVRACTDEPFVFQGYPQDLWVSVQHYQDAHWPDLVDLWRGYNRHLARLMEAVPEDVRLELRHPHNLHKIAMQPVPEEQPATLDYLMRDYVRHVHHHLTQITALLSTPL